jgi:hypothetical protein
MKAKGIGKNGEKVYVLERPEYKLYTLDGKRNLEV